MVLTVLKNHPVAISKCLGIQYTDQSPVTVDDKLIIQAVATQQGLVGRVNLPNACSDQNNHLSPLSKGSQSNVHSVS
jgi:predicted nucleic acid binding AN1-type Zn finger protein